MMTLSPALNAGQATAYHELDYVSPAQSYYQQGDAVRGQWQGQLVREFGLQGDVDREAFARLANGQHPVNGEQLVRHRQAHEYTTEDGKTVRSVEHRAGWDAQFAPSKSVSLTALVGGDDRIREAHREAVKAALRELEAYTHARLGSNKPAEQTGRFVAATFEHDTARPVEGYAAPQLHTHAVIFNVTRREDGSTRALQERPLFESQRYAGTVYQSELFYRLRQLGYQVERGKSGAPEIKGYSPEYLEASSPRSRQIREHLEQLGVSGPKAAQIAAHQTRDRKGELSPKEVLMAHRALAEEYGNQPWRVIAEAHERAMQPEINPTRPNPAKQALTYAKESIFEREATADERTILTAAMRRSMGEATFAQVRNEFNVQWNQGRLVPSESRRRSSIRAFTTPELIAAERSNIERMREGISSVRPMMNSRDAKIHVAQREFLNNSQREAALEVLNSPNRIHGLQGLAGTGKTSALATIRLAAEKSGYMVEGFAPTSRAARQLRDAGIVAGTLQHFLARADQLNDIRPRFYMIDESSLASTRQMQGFLNRLQPKDRVLMIGDIRQHQAIEAGKPFEQLQQAGMPTARLDRIIRQKNPELLKAVEQLAAGETRAGIGLLADQGRIREVADPKQRVAALAKDYAANPENTLIVSPDNRSRLEINQAVRSEMRGRGLLKDDGRSFQVLTHRGELTGSDRAWAARYNPGDVLQYNTGSREHGIPRNSFARVKSVDPAANEITVETDSGNTITYDPRRLRGVNVFEETSREFATGDRVQFTAPNKALHVANRDLGTIEAIAENKITVRLDGKDNRSVTFDSEKFRQVDHGYAVTSHSAQGITAERVLIHADTSVHPSLLNSRFAYVAVSRASQEAMIFTDSLAKLSPQLSVDLSKSSALEVSLPKPTIAEPELALSI